MNSKYFGQKLWLYLKFNFLLSVFVIPVVAALFGKNDPVWNWEGLFINWFYVQSVENGSTHAYAFWLCLSADVDLILAMIYLFLRLAFFVTSKEYKPDAKAILVMLGCSTVSVLAFLTGIGNSESVYSISTRHGLLHNLVLIGVITTGMQVSVSELICQLLAYVRQPDQLLRQIRGSDG